MKKLRNNVAVLALLAAVVLGTVPASASAALTSDNKAELKAVFDEQSELSGDNSTRALYEIMMYLMTLLKGTTDTTPVKTSSIPEATPNALPTERYNASICTNLKTINSTLRLNSDTSQVKALQQSLNLISRQDTRYSPIARLGNGSLGNETTYFGPATEVALKRFQDYNLNDGTYQAGVFDSVTQAKMRALYCGSDTSTKTETTTSTSKETTTTTKTNEETSAGGETASENVPKLTLELSQERPGNIGGDNWWMVTLAWNVDGFGTCKLQTKPDGGTYTSGISLVPPTTQGLTNRNTIDIRKSSTFRISCPRGQMSKEIYVPVNFNNNTTTNTNDTAEGTDGGDAYVRVTSPELNTYDYHNRVTGGGPVTISGTAGNTSKIKVMITDDIKGTHIQTCYVSIREGVQWSCKTASAVTAVRIKVQIWDYNDGSLGESLHTFTAVVEAPDVPSTSVSTYDQNGRVISNGDMTVNLTSPGYGSYKPGDTFTIAGTASGMFYVSLEAVGSGWKSGYGTSLPSKAWSKSWTLPSTIKPGDIDVKLYGAKTAQDHIDGNKVYIGEFSVDVK